MDKIKLNIENAVAGLKPGAFDALAPVAQDAFNTLVSGNGAGNDFLGWVKLPSETPATLLADIKATADDLRSKCQVVVAIGIGGSYLG
ncbi:MAG: glucose-6-phosphate isomerase, partial [Muribaculaceae bacterium]|nr:glucose-6-phosphate isomerase [Muribaculaceae bacterium]